MSTCGGRFWWRDVLRSCDANRTTGDLSGLTVLSSKILAVLLMTGGFEQNPAPAVEVEKGIRILCTGCGRNLKSGIQYEPCERCYNYSCGIVKTQAAERERIGTVKCVGLKM